jgi:hypothetical protein
VSVLLHVLAPVIYVVHRDLHPLLWPAHVTHFEDMTIIQFNKASLRAEIIFWGMAHLTEDERTTLRLAYEVNPDLSRPVPDDLLDGLVETMPIPPCLRPPTTWQESAQSA